MSMKIIKEKTLLEECIEALGEETVILSQKDSDDVLKTFEDMFPIVYWGRIDWEKIDDKVYISDTSQIIPAIEKLLKRSFDTSIYILWNEGSLPTVRGDLKSALIVIEDVTCVGPDTWFFNPLERYIVEFFHEGEVVVGIAPTKEERTAILLKTLSNIKSESNNDKIKWQIYFLSEEINRLLRLIETCATIEVANIYFDLLQKVQEVLSGLVFERKVRVSRILIRFIKDCDQIDDPSLREHLFKKIKHGNVRYKE